MGQAAAITKHEAAKRLAATHFRIDPGVVKIVELVGDHRSDAIRLLEVNEETAEDGIYPFHFDADPPRGVVFPTVLIEVTPHEFEQIQRGQLPLPYGWRLGGDLSPNGNS